MNAEGNPRRAWGWWQVDWVAGRYVPDIALCRIAP